MDFKKLAENLGLELNEYLELLEIFIQTSLSTIEKLKTAIEEENSEEIANFAHSLKGSSANYGFDDISKIANEIEQNTRNNNLNLISDKTDLIKEKIENLIKLSQKLKTN